MDVVGGICRLGGRVALVIFHLMMWYPTSTALSRFPCKRQELYWDGHVDQLQLAFV